MPKVLSIVPYKIFPAKLGGQKGIALFNEYLARETALVCITVKSNQPGFAKGYLLLNVLSDSFYRYINPFYFFAVRKLLVEHGATHLILEHPYYGWLGIFLKWVTGVKLIVHSHNMEAMRWKSLGRWWWKILWLYERQTHRKADYNLFIHDDDKAYAIKQFKLDPFRCITMTYGIEWDRIPPQEEIRKAKVKLRNDYNISQAESILLFNGDFNYQPNLLALYKIIDTIDPILRQKKDFRYRIIICGRGIPMALTETNHPSIIYAGFVDDISIYFKGADVFLNPVTEGGGIKTKLVEALGYNLNAVSTFIGAIGIDPGMCNGKLLICNDGDWDLFCTGIVDASLVKADIGPAYFEHFYWGYSVGRIARFIESE